LTLPAALAAAVVDCEAIHTGWPQQPVNAWSSLAFVVVGIVLIGRGVGRPARATGVAAGLVGVGSLLFHGRHTDFTGWAHDWSIVVLLVVLLTFAGGGPVTFHYLGAVLIGAALLVWLAPESGEWLHGVLAGAVALRELMLRDGRRRRPMIVAAWLLAAGAVLAVLGRSGAPWCDPGSILQPHAAWHALGAAALASYSIARSWLRGVAADDA
jgi:hypothetical protein